MKYFNSSGLSFKYHGDIVTWKWPWGRNSSRAPYHSSLLNRDFNSFKEYWFMFGQDRALLQVSTGDGKVHGFDLIKELLPEWSSRVWPNEFLVCLCHIDPAARSQRFWSMLKKEQINEMLKDVVVLRCKDLTEMETLVESIDRNFADAVGVCNGRLLLTNQPF